LRPFLLSINGVRYMMLLYHFTSLENLEKIWKIGCILPQSIYEGKNLLWLTKIDKKHQQYWANGTNKTEVRIMLYLMDFAKFKFPEAIALRHDMFKLGADNWYFAYGQKYMDACVKIDIYNNNLRRYVNNWKSKSINIKKILR